PYLLSKHQGDKPRILLSERPALARICSEYAECLNRSGFEAESVIPYGWNNLKGGIPFDSRMRRLYRSALEVFEKGMGPEPANPLDGSSTDRFMAWLNEPVTFGLKAGVSRYLRAIYDERPDLQRAFPDLAGANRSQYINWAHVSGVVEEKIPTQLLP